MVFTEEDVHHVSSVLSALGNPTRFRIIELVSETERPLHIKAVAQMLNKDYAAIYRHIKVLEKSGLVGIYEVGRSRVIHLKNKDLTKQLVQTAKKIFQSH